MLVLPDGLKAIHEILVSKIYFELFYEYTG